jgi:perosamine synthetase
MSSKQASRSAGGRIGLCEPHIAGKEWDYFKECLDTAWVSSAGPFVERFESDMAAFLGGDVEAVAVVNGTSALHIALLLAGVEPDDEVLVSDLTFIAPAFAVRYCGAWPVLTDVDPLTWQMDPELVKKFLSEDCQKKDGALFNKKSGRRVKAILPVHLLGHPVDMDPILEAARENGLIVVEDATESLGASYKERPVGVLGDMACLSFNGNKLITTGGGGMVITRRPEWAGRARYLTTQAKDDPVEYVHGEVGFNYRLTNLQAAVGCAQLERIKDLIQKKRAIAQRYDEALADLPGIGLMPRADWAGSVFWLYTVLLDAEVYGRGRKELMKILAEAGIQTRPLWQPLHLSPALAGCLCLGGSNAASIQNQALSLPSSSGLSLDQQQTVIDALHDFANGSR